MDINIKHFIPKEEHRGALETLLFQLSGKKRSVNLETHPDSYLIGAFESEKLIGFTQIFVLHKCAFTFGLLEDVIVDEIYRNQGIGKRLILQAISHAKEKGAERVNLTSRPKRRAARKLYESLGFIKQETEVFRLELTV